MKQLVSFIVLVCILLSSCTNTLTPPIVRTISASAQSATTITATGKIISDYGLSILSYGLCLSQDSLPTTGDTKKEHLPGTYIMGTEFNDSYTGLAMNETYYVRAYAINSDGVAYGKSICVKTYFPIILSTEIPTTITLNSVVCSGDISNASKLKITACGFCWSTTKNPTINDNKTINGKEAGAFCDTLTGLKSNTTYYIRTYATSKNEIIYGNEVSFQTLKWIDGTTVTDIDGNIYHTVTIGTQVWMVENLKTKHYINGDLIPNITDINEWDNLKTGAYCDFANDPVYSEIYGKLYNWYTVKDTRKIAPTGWHVSSYEDWTTLCNYLGGTDIAGGKLKEIGVEHWFEPNVGATNEVGFTALEGGAHITGGYNPYNGWWWTTTFQYIPWGGDLGTLECPWLIKMFFYNATLSYGYTRLINWGLSIRCVLD